MIMHKCGRSLIEPSAVSAPMDFLTSEAEYRRVWQVFKHWLCSAVSAKLRACVPRFFSLSYRVFNLGICIPTLEFDESFLNRYGISQEQSLSSKSSLSPRAPKQVEFSREALGKGAGLPSARASYALEGLLCAVGKEAGLGATLLVDCGVGVLAARGRVTKFTFVQLALARARETTSLLRSLREVQADRFLPPDGVEGEEGMPTDNGVVAAMRAWNPGRSSASSASSAGTGVSGSLAFSGDGNDGDIRTKNGLLGKNATGAAKITAGEIAGSTVRARIGLGRMTLPLRGFRDRGRTPVGIATGESAAATAATVVSPPPPPPLMDVHARLRGSVLSASPSPMARLLDATTAPSPSSPNGDRGIANSVLPERKQSRAAAVEPGTRPTGHLSLWLEPTGVERLGSYYSPAAQLLYLDVNRGCLAWRENANTGGFTCNEGGSNTRGVGGGLGSRILAPATPKLARRDAARGQTSPTDSANPQVYVGMVANVTRVASQGGPNGVNATVVTGTGSSEKDGHKLGLRTPHMESECHNRPAYAGGGGGGGGPGVPSSSEARQMSRPHDSSHSSRNDGQEGRSETWMSSSPPDATPAKAGVQSPELPSDGNNNTVGPLVPESSPGRERTSDRNCPPRAGQVGALAGCEVTYPPRSSSPPVKRNQTPPAVLSKIRRRPDDETGQRDDDRLPCPGEGRGSMEGERAELWMGQRSGGNGDRGGWAASAGAVQAANPELEVSDAAGRRQAGFARYHHYLQCDSTLAESVTVLQPPWQAGIVRKVVHGLSGRGGGGGGGCGGGGCNTSGRHSGTPRGWDLEKSNDEEDTSSESDNGGVGVRGIGGGRYSRPGCKDVGGTGTENIPAKDAQEGGEGEEEEGEEGDVFEVHVEGPAPVAKTAQHKVPYLAVTSGGDQPPQSPTTNSGGGRGVVGGGSVFTSRVDGTPRATAFNRAANTAKRPRARTPRGVAGPGPGEARMPEVPDGWKAGVEACLEETCEAFRASIRRAVLNYVVLDAGQRDRLGISAVPPGFASQGWGWGKGRGIQKSPPEWQRRFVRAREALNMGQITGSPALVAAQALLAKCRGTRLLRLPKSAAEIQASSWSAMTAEEFRSSQLSHLSRKARRVRRLLYPGLSEALKAQLGVGSKGTRATTAELATRTKSSPPDGHVRRYLAAVNVMTASILRGMVETAISDLQIFLEDRCSSPNSDRGSTLTCRKSLRDLKEAVMDVVREVVLCFADVPRVVYDCRTAGDQASGGYHLVDPSTPAGRFPEGIDDQAFHVGKRRWTTQRRCRQVDRGHRQRRKASSEARAACRIYRPFESLLQEAATALAPKTAAEATGVSEKDLSGLASALRRYKSTAAVLRTGGDAAPVELQGGIVVVDCQKTSEKLLQVAGDLCKGVLQRVTSTLNKLTSGVTKQARSAILRLGKRPRSTEEMVEAIECLRTMRAEEQIKLRQEQIWMGQLLDFVFEHGGLHHDVIIAVTGVHRVMSELSTATDKAEKAIAEGKAQLQKNVEKAKRRVEGNVDSTKMRIAEFIDSDARPREMSENAASISKELAGLKAQAVDIGEEEAKVDGHTSGTLVALAEKVIVSFQPYADLWSLVGSVGPFITTIMRAPVTTLNPEEITAEHASIKQRLEALIKIMEAKSHANPTKAAQESLRLLAALEKDIPILKALTNPHLKDRHWWQISALAGVTVSVEHPTTLQQLNELDVLTDTKADAILRLSDDADAEHALETSTAEVDRFVSEEAVLRISLVKGSGDGEDGAGVEKKSPAADVEPEGKNGRGAAGAAEEGKQSGVVVERIDEDHLKRILGQVDRWRKVISDIRLTDAAKAVASTDAAAAAAATEGSEQSEGWASPGVVEALDTALSDLTLVGEGMLKCAELVVDIETQLDETTGDEVDREELLKDAVKRWRDFLMAHCGQSLKDLVGDVEKERVHLDEVLDS
ncbi:similar to Dynein heavy chain 3, axonemal (Axonemal beta dynein heavy chain 3) (Ciliary dynein heavy chain 3) [Ectocarpus siliculosus]|uniref:Similar to Dynein heavy chain 3, axonemal (Axonemal beta dynein heavy chain 3) (Ciliary dynein heavy chain 3), partial n=1 Tax=Ectocarpus siliculosus TaxID=2880 RepID=D7G491_ECTSI|nr:similar to Dynein heavy chain 3, axonemal (Axonemal beta dynein heavy chain 3) (Ciliary dynein heavy chain 3) [Ectocarpus siliculosus]|eukprot:CBJ27106.1 similar to Dynein heavy chain 3, axonemal (Axonemal beta dynein heavy chain 3) (Ciliary dynein heavy chain 3) [Ectocarpus siliculosus]